MSQEQNPLALDHLVINAHYDLDELAQAVAELGFCLTPQGYHALGSINHLAVFGHTYLELIGLPTDGDTIRQEIAQSFRGIDGLVFATSNAQATQELWRQGGLQTTPVQQLSRAVDFHGETKEARFATVRLLPGQVTAGRVYACEQKTPELVWQERWQHHAEPFIDLSGLTIVAGQPERTRAIFARLGAISPDIHIAIDSKQQFVERFDELAAYGPEREDFFGAIHIRVKSLGGIAAKARGMEVPFSWDASQETLTVALPDFEALLVFEQAGEAL